jgi:dihydroxyacetone kinase-like protein
VFWLSRKVQRLKGKTLAGTLDCGFVKSFLLDLAAVIMQRKDDLNRLDAECGDGDFGVGMYVAFQHVQQAVGRSTEGDIGALLIDVGRAILSSAGGASGPLFGTLFIEAGRAVEGRTEIDLASLESMFRGALRGICQRGGANVGDKTLVDSLEPATVSFGESAQAGIDLQCALGKAAEAARLGSESTKKLIAKHGKARYLGEQTLGHEDPGAYVIALLFQTLADRYRAQSIPS